ncbi:MAG: hypothetical protein PF503_18735 [Desulfobacula sp.]|jgi:hypothetical protein|nr:hypothetical protein [Desulfobacula sp.]
MKVGNKVEWFSDRYSVIKNYGTIVKMGKATAKTPQAKVRDQDGFESWVPVRELNWGC